MGVSPFGHPRIEAYLQLPAAYRSLSRPSSAPDAKAFALRSFLLELSFAFCVRVSFRIRVLNSTLRSNCLPFFDGKTRDLLCEKRDLCVFPLICSFTLCFLYSVFNDHGPDSGLSRSLVGSSGLEPPTSRLSGARSNRLSYEPVSYRSCSTPVVSQAIPRSASIPRSPAWWS